MVEMDLSEISSEVIRSILKNTVEKQLNSTDYKINLSSASQAGDNNFIGIVYRVSFNKTNDIEDGKFPSKLILKVAPENVFRRAQFFSRASFLREIYMYEKVRKLQINTI